MRVISEDSAAAILDAKFNPLQIIASTSVLVKPPYRGASAWLAEPVFTAAENNYNVIVHEAELSRDLLDKIEAHVVHLDMSFKAIPVEELSAVAFANMQLSSKTRQNLLKILPKLRTIAGEIRRKHGLDVLAIGKHPCTNRRADSWRSSCNLPLRKSS